jgi:hypothetical protein
MSWGRSRSQALLAAKWRPDRGLWPGRPVMLIAIVGVLASLLVAVHLRLALDFGLVTYVPLALCGIGIAMARARPAASTPTGSRGPVQSAQLFRS